MPVICARCGVTCRAVELCDECMSCGRCCGCVVDDDELGQLDQDDYRTFAQLELRDLSDMEDDRYYWD